MNAWLRLSGDGRWATGDAAAMRCPAGFRPSPRLFAATPQVFAATPQVFAAARQVFAPPPGFLRQPLKFLRATLTIYLKLALESWMRCTFVI